MSKNLYRVKSKLQEARTAEKLSRGFFKKGDYETGSKLAKQRNKLEKEAVDIYVDIVGETMHRVYLYDLFGIEGIE